MASAAQPAPNFRDSFAAVNHPQEHGYNRWMRGEATYKRLTIGSDPEIFLLDGNGDVFPAWEFAPEKTPRSVYFWDGFQAEIAPAWQNCQAEHFDAVRYALMQLLLGARNRKATARFTLDTVVKVPEKVLETALPQYVALGCSPSCNAYGMAGAEVYDPRQLKYRFAGGHIHFGGVPHDKAEQVVKMLDASIGIASVSLYAGFENPIRRNFYGLAGEYRLPPHGLEYRVLSNVWLGHPALAHLTFDLARQAVKFAETTPVASSVFEGSSDQFLQETINNLDVNAARAYIERNKAVYRRLFAGYYGDNYIATKALSTLQNGIGDKIPELAKVETNWRMSGEWKPYGASPNCTWVSFAQSCK